VAEDIRSNGIVMSPDDKTLYVTNGGTLSVFDVPSPGKLANRREWKLEAGGNGDGSTVDANGRVYVASGPGVQIFTPQGKYLGLIPTPRGLTGEAFAGPAKRTLYVVGTGSTDANGHPDASGATGRTIYRIPMLAEGLQGRSK
jgi:gluconolactonase